jgi:hypothetical protein
LKRRQHWDGCKSQPVKRSPFVKLTGFGFCPFKRENIWSNIRTFLDQKEETLFLHRPFVAFNFLKLIFAEKFMFCKKKNIYFRTLNEKQSKINSINSILTACIKYSSFQIADNFL